MLTSKQILYDHGKDGVNLDVLRYARDTGKLKFSVICDDGRVHFEYDENDVENWINNYLKVKGKRRGNWRGVSATTKSKMTAGQKKLWEKRKSCQK